MSPLFWEAKSKGVGGQMQPARLSIHLFGASRGLRLSNTASSGGANRAVNEGLQDRSREVDVGLGFDVTWQGIIYGKVTRAQLERADVPMGVSPDWYEDMCGGCPGIGHQRISLSDSCAMVD